MILLLVLVASLFAPGAATAGTIPAETEPLRIAFFGNSITAHGPSALNDWPYYHGMAATQPDLDYVHQVQLMLAARTGSVPEIEVVHADIHLFLTKDIDGTTLDGDSVQAFDPDLVIVAMGDNADPVTLPDEWLYIYQQIVAWTPHADQRIALGLWRSLDIRESRLQYAASETGMTYVAIHDLYMPGVTDGSGHGFTDAGVRWHPGNLGMRLIAERIMAAIAVQKIYAPIVMEEQ